MYIRLLFYSVKCLSLKNLLGFGFAKMFSLVNVKEREREKRKKK